MRCSASALHDLGLSREFILEMAPMKGKDGVHRGWKKPTIACGKIEAVR
jgi:hypothetical protein